MSIFKDMQSSQLLTVQYVKHHLPSNTSAHCPYSLRKRQHYYQVPTTSSWIYTV